MWKIKGYITSKVLNLAPKSGLRAALPLVQRATPKKGPPKVPCFACTDLGSSWEVTYWETGR